MASKSKLKKLASIARMKEHEAIKAKKEQDKDLWRHGIHPDQNKAIAMRLEANNKRVKPKRFGSLTVKHPSVYRRETPNYPSVTSTGAHVAEKRERNTYTGDKLIGIGMMHKSNLVPIFSEEHARDVSNMRRN